MRKPFVELGISLIIAFVVVSVCIAMFYLLVPDQYETNYVEVMWDKYNKLHSIDEPKVVLIGDSNLAFGIDSEYIEKQIHMPVVNMGLHGGLGNDIQTRIAMSNVREGDIYVICYTDYNQSEDISQKDLTLIMLAHHSQLWDTLTLKQKIELIPAIPDYIFNSMSYYIRGRGNEDLELEHSDYSRKGFNEFGDNTVRVDKNRIENYSDYVPVYPTLSNETKDSIIFWKEYCDNRKAKLVLAAYPLIMNERQYESGIYNRMFGEAEGKTGCKFISDINKYMLPQDMFYDGPLHLTIEGAHYRSELLAKELIYYIEQVDE